MENKTALYVIESGIPLPKRKLMGDEFPFASMKVGDSFKLNGEFPASVGSMAGRFARKQNPPWKFKVAKVDEGYRCWRLQ